MEGIVKEFFRPKEACLYLGCKMATLYRWEKRGVLRNKERLSRRIVGWRKEELDRCLSRLTASADDPSGIESKVVKQA